MFRLVGTESCKFCKLAEALLKANNLPFTKEILKTDEEIAQFKAQGFATVPQIWRMTPPTRGFLHIGGYDDLVKYLAAQTPS